MRAGQEQAPTAAAEALVHKLLDRFSAGDVDGVAATMTPDATWWNARGGGVDCDGMTIDVLTARMRAMAPALVGGAIVITPKSFVSRADRVTVEATNHAELANGLIYDNVAHFVFEIRDGLISAVREYSDTEHAAAVFHA